MDDVSRRLYSAAQLRELEQRAIAAGVSGYELMQRAALACWQELRRRWPKARRLHVICGPGNNGGDGYEIARLALAEGLAVKVCQIGAAPASGDGRRAREAWSAVRGQVTAGNTPDLADADVVVDAVFGIGLRRPLDLESRAVVAAINARGVPVLSVDLPSGLDADSGRVYGAAVRADVTVTFIGRKPGLYSGAGPEHAGDVVFNSLDLAASVHAPLEPAAHLLDAKQLQAWLPPRARGAHKGSHGHVLVIGGDHGMMGAALLAARGALRGGAGLVSVATRVEHAPAMTAAQPELMCVGVESAKQLAPLLGRASAVVMGPGLGQESWGRMLLAAVLEQRLPLVVDADALNLLAQEPVSRPDWVLTPHPGEAARLLAVDAAGIQQDRGAAARHLREKFKGVVVLKGAGTLVQGERLHLCPRGNPGMAVGGMGDVLAGVIGAFMGQGLAVETAATAGVLAHALAGDAAACEGERGLLPSDLLRCLRHVVNP